VFTHLQRVFALVVVISHQRVVATNVSKSVAIRDGRDIEAVDQSRTYHFGLVFDALGLIGEAGTLRAEQS